MFEGREVQFSNDRGRAHAAVPGQRSGLAQFLRPCLPTRRYVQGLFEAPRQAGEHGGSRASTGGQLSVRAATRGGPHVSIAWRERSPYPVLYLAPWVDLGGSDKGTIDWFKHINQERWAPSLIVTQPSANRWLHQVEPWAEEVWNLPDLMRGCDFPAFILGFIESRRVEVVHIMNSRLSFDLMPDMTCLTNPPAIVVQMHAEEPDRSGYVRYVATRYGNLVDAFSLLASNLRQQSLSTTFLEAVSK